MLIVECLDHPFCGFVYTLPDFVLSIVLVPKVSPNSQEGSHSHHQSNYKYGLELTWFEGGEYSCEFDGALKGPSQNVCKFLVRLSGKCDQRYCGKERYKSSLKSVVSFHVLIYLTMIPLPYSTISRRRRPKTVGFGTSWRPATVRLETYQGWLRV